MPGWEARSSKGCRQLAKPNTDTFFSWQKQPLCVWVGGHVCVQEHVWGRGPGRGARLSDGVHGRQRGDGKENWSGKGREGGSASGNISMSQQAEDPAPPHWFPNTAPAPWLPGEPSRGCMGTNHGSEVAEGACLVVEVTTQSKMHWFARTPFPD